MELKSRVIVVYCEIFCYIWGEGSFDVFEIFIDEYIIILKWMIDVKLNIVNECFFIEVNNVELCIFLNFGGF